ncbi:MAG: radical SAM family heme chaperone HemW [Gammaproteobacteria bacterium]|nr:radical SAM family heme chaperone HemW [Gammaproteobacteria bacterium]
MHSFATLPPLALYAHLPWCVKKCPYCDFNSNALTDTLPEAHYIETLLRDLEHYLPRAQDRSLTSIFIGGGTPSLFAPESIDALLGGIRVRLPCAPDIEITLEANPGTVEIDRFKGYREAGVNRLSIGVQSFQPNKLIALGRIHGADDAMRAGHAAVQAGFSNFNVDLMYGLPHQDAKDALADLNTALQLGPTHISLYQLTIEPNTYFYKNPPPLPDDETLWDMQCTLQATLADAGFRQYEVSSYAKDGRQCLHNLNYWTFGDYLGIGAGAHSKITDAHGISRVHKPKHPRQYMAIASTAQGLGIERRLERTEVGLEFMMNGLRLCDGFATPLFQHNTGLPISLIDRPVTQAERRQLLIRTPGRIYPTLLGFRFLNDLLELFLPEARDTEPKSHSTQVAINSSQLI